MNRELNRHDIRFFLVLCVIREIVYLCGIHILLNFHRSGTFSILLIFTMKVFPCAEKHMFCIDEYIFFSLKILSFSWGGGGEARCFSTIWISFMYMQKQKECFYFSSDFLFSFSPRTVHVNFALIYFEIFFLLLTFIMKDVIWEKIYINEYIFFRNFFVLSNTIISLEEKLHFFSVLKIWSFL